MMNQIDIICTYRKSLFKIIDGPLKGKFCKIMAIDFLKEIIETEGSGKVIPAELLRPCLRSWKDLKSEECIKIYELYFDENKVREWREEDDRPTFVVPRPADIIRIVEGYDVVQGDFKEVQEMIAFAISINIDCYNLIEQEQAIHYL